MNDSIVSSLMWCVNTEASIKMFERLIYISKKNGLTFDYTTITITDEC